MRGIIVAPDETVASTGDPGSQVAARCNLDIILDDVVVIDNSAGINASEVPDRRSLANLHIWGDHCGTDEQKRDQLAACCQDQFENADEPWHHHVIPNGTLHNIPDDPDKRTCNLGFSKIRQRLGFAAKETLYQGIVETKGAVEHGPVKGDDPIRYTLQWYKSLIEWQNRIDGLMLGGKLL